MATKYNFQKLCIFGFAINICTSYDPCYFKGCYLQNYCSLVAGYAVCSCPSGYQLLLDNKTCLSDLCYEKNCTYYNYKYYCDVVSGIALCSCPYGYYLQSDNRTCVDFYTLCGTKRCYSYSYCKVVSGNAICSCPNGFYLQSDNRTCLDFYALCDTKRCYSYSYCNVVSGNAICSCPSGFYLQSDNRTCLDTNSLCSTKGCYSSNYCYVVSGNAVCSCPYGYYLQPDKRTCLVDPTMVCELKRCYNCHVVSGKAICSCPSGYYLDKDGFSCTYGQNPCNRCYSLSYCKIVSRYTANCLCPPGYYLLNDGHTCLSGTQLSDASIVLIIFGVIFCVFLTAFSLEICLRRKRKVEPVTVLFYAATESAVVQEVAQNHLNSVNVQIGVNNTTDSNILYPSNEIGVDNAGHFNMAPPPYELIAQSPSVSAILSPESPPEYSN